MRGALTKAVVAIGVLPAVLYAQRVKGTLHDSASTMPLNGAVVSVVDSTGAVTARAVVDGAGTFSLPLTAAAARLRVIRIGYRPRDVPLPSNRSHGDVSVVVSLSRIPPILETVRVSGTELCPGSTDRGAAFQLWDQARAGLLATVVARETNPADVAALAYQRNVGPSDDLIMHQIAASRLGRTSRPFKAAAKPETFAKSGYIEQDSTGARTYYAPDEQVLLDESFAATHCFHIQPPDTAHVGQLGLAFTPARGRDTIVDVTGVIWMDAVTPAVRALDFRYTNLEPAAMNAASGGHVEFQSLSNGVSFIDWWNLRFPLLSRVARASSMGPTPPETRRRRERVDYRVDQMVESGGEVLMSRWKDGTTWQSPNSGVAGTVTQRGSQAPIPFALVSLAGTADTAMADAQGRFDLAPIPAGHYSLVVRDTTLSGYVADRLAKRLVTVSRDSLTPVTVELQSPTDLITALCKDQPARTAPSVILGHLDTPDPRGIEVRATWNALAARADANIAVETTTRESTVDDRGHFLICAPGRGQAVRLRVVREDVPADTSIVTNDSLITSVRWTLPRLPGVRPELTAFAAPAPGRSSARAAPASDTPPRRPRATVPRRRRT
jgi:hypothetical protein